jgi:predicted kinase
VLATNACEDWDIVALVLLNGLPGIGKSTLARQVASIEASIVIVEVDAYRAGRSDYDTNLAKADARLEAVAAIGGALADGRDVIVPQFLGREEFVATLAGLAERFGARFVHALVVGTPEVAIERFRRRRSELRDSGQPHPEAEIDDVHVDGMIRGAAVRLSKLASPATILVADTPRGAQTLLASIVVHRSTENSDRAESRNER